MMAVSLFFFFTSVRQNTMASTMEKKKKTEGTDCLAKSDMHN